MCCKDLGADCTAAWPSAEIAVMGSEAAVEVLYRRELAESHDNGAKRRELVQQFSDMFASPYVAASRRLVDDIIEPAQTRAYLADALDALANKRDWRPQKKHGLIPL